jgi:hypothetical protein
MDDAAWREVLEKNQTERQHLEQLAQKLTVEDLSQSMEAGWTVSAVLAHLAFWDIRAYILITQWNRSGVGPSAIDTDVINEVTRELCLAIPPRAAAQLALDKALALDNLLAALKPELIEAIRTVGTTVHLERSAHRRLHLEEIEKTLSARLSRAAPAQ